MYVTNFLSKTVSVISTNTNKVGAPMAVGIRPLEIAFDPTHDRLYVSYDGNDQVSVIDTNTNTVVGLPLIAGVDPEVIAFASLQPL